jgi:hypothetical protein
MSLFATSSFRSMQLQIIAVYQVVFIVVGHDYLRTIHSLSTAKGNKQASFYQQRYPQKSHTLPIKHHGTEVRGGGLCAKEKYYLGSPAIIRVNGLIATQPLRLPCARGPGPPSTWTWSPACLD